MMDAHKKQLASLPLRTSAAQSLVQANISFISSSSSSSGDGGGAGGSGKEQGGKGQQKQQKQQQLVEGGQSHVGGGSEGQKVKESLLDLVMLGLSTDNNVSFLGGGGGEWRLEGGVGAWGQLDFEDGNPI